MVPSVETAAGSRRGDGTLIREPSRIVRAGRNHSGIAGLKLSRLAAVARFQTHNHPRSGPSPVALLPAVPIEAILNLRRRAAVLYDSCLNMSTNAMVCDGCGQSATPDHLTRRFKRLEETTRFRPVHIQTVFLSDVSPLREAEFLYAHTPESFQGEALALLKALDIVLEGKSREAALAEFQRRGCLLAHVLECPLDAKPEKPVQELLDARLAASITRLKRSLKPKRVVLVAAALAPFTTRLREAGLEAEIGFDAALAAGGLKV